MKHWYVKDLSALTHVSVQTLHHYDRINLLKPSDRLPNGYRVYSEKDLSKLQQILALKFFGFELAQIKTLLSSDINLIDHFMTQSKFLEEKANALAAANTTLKSIIADYSQDKSIPWETIINLIEVYRMTQQIENTWVAKIFTPEELKNYAKFEQELKTRFTESEKDACHQEWTIIVQDVHDNLKKDPSAPASIAIAEHCMNWVMKLYGKENVLLSKAIWEKGFKEGHGAHDHGLSREGVAWLDKAIYAYHTQRIRNVLDKIQTHTTEEVVLLWNALLTDMYDDNQALKLELHDKIMLNDKIPQSTKDWLKLHGNNRKQK